jgi:hypothetical protein
VLVVVEVEVAVAAAAADRGRRRAYMWRAVHGTADLRVYVCGEGALTGAFKVEEINAAQSKSFAPLPAGLKCR